ncbi:hypothetical protein AAG570_003114 [Ranatra chinensis]|uniref:Uncharacterized protein n=1 Tax=Ranatra chinensis TaxID=642074 RepID=A0ABD0YNS2_9HEMI
MIRTATKLIAPLIQSLIRPHDLEADMDLLLSLDGILLPTSPDLAPPDFQLFTELKQFLIGKHFSNNEEVKEAMEKRLSEVELNVFDEGIKKVVPRLKKCIKVDGYYVDK